MSATRPRPLGSARRRPFGRAALLAAAVALAGLATAAPVTRAAATTAGPETGRVLLALGDSLASGYQPTYGHRLPPLDPATGLPDQGYPGSYPADLAAAEHLRLVDLACPGETTASFAGTPAQAACGTLYRKATGAGSQLQAALAWLAAHRAAVALVTIDLGANDVVGCHTGTSLSLGCVSTAAAAARRRLGQDLTRLTRALARDDPGARVAGMTYYDPFLALAYRPGGPTGLAEAALSVAGLGAFNAVLAATYRAHGAVVADVAAAFATGSLRPLITFRGVPLAHDAGVVCQLTWMCPPPHGRRPDIHPTTAGYARIAHAFLVALRRAGTR